VSWEASAKTESLESLLSIILLDLCCLEVSPIKFRRSIAWLANLVAWGDCTLACAINPCRSLSHSRYSSIKCTGTTLFEDLGVAGLEVKTIIAWLPRVLTLKLGGKLVPHVPTLKDLMLEFLRFRSIILGTAD
jgi:hypothetical protein